MMNDPIPDVTPIAKHLEAVYAPYALLAAMQLDVFSALESTRSANAVADLINVDAERLEILLYALAAADLLQVEAGRFTNTPATSYYLVKGKPNYIGDLHHILANIWNAVAFTTETIRTGHPQGKVDYEADKLSEDEIAVFKGLFTSSGRSVKHLMKAYDLGQHHHLVDIGGGSGGIAVTLTDTYPDLHVTILDLPGVISLTKRFTASAFGHNRIHMLAGDVVENSIPGSYDAALMRAFTQVLSPVAVRASLKHTYDALQPESVLYIVTRVLDDSRKSPVSSALFNLVFINIYDDGQAYTQSQYRQWLEEAGFTKIEFTMIPGTDAIIRARRPT
jgi:hypothetical protein